MSQERLLLSQERPMWRPGGSLSFSNTYRGGTLLWEDEGEGQDRRTGAERRAADRRRGERRIGALGDGSWRPDERGAPEGTESIPDGQRRGVRRSPCFVLGGDRAGPAKEGLAPALPAPPSRRGTRCAKRAR